MKNISVDFNRTAGKIKPMHAVNNGPAYKFASDQRITNLDAYRDAGIPYARIHDAAFCATYGGEHVVDIVNIFPDFDADVNDPASYDFQLTDEYLRVIELGGAKTFYRLGNKIEHWSKKYGTLPPKDFRKWAEICEHIIRHYTEGWADGFHMDIEYWEIWNEPDLDPDDSTHKRCWGGTKAQFFELYDIAATHLKKCFPHLKIGGPALAGTYQWAEDFLAQLKAPLDFFSWHAYASDPKPIAALAVKMRRLLDKYGFTETESILNEWNYVRGWHNDDWIYSLKMEKGLKGSSFITGTMCACQYEDLDMLMYYDARPCGMNGMFSTDRVCDCLKGYYPFRMFRELYELGEAGTVQTDENAFACAAKNSESAAIMFTHYSDDDSTPEDLFKIQITGLAPEEAIRAEILMLDTEHDMELVREEYFTGAAYTLIQKMPLHATCLIRLIPCALPQ